MTGLLIKAIIDLSTWAGLFKAGLRGSSKFEFRYESLKSKIQFNSFCQQFDDWLL